jgi:UDP-N-acetylmuramate--alanine ligase
MVIYCSGISGVGIGPLAELAHDAGYTVYGSDLHAGLITPELEAVGIQPHFGEQDGQYLQQIHDEVGIDWFIHTSAIKPGHPELELANKLGIRTSKRDEFLAEFIDSHDLKLIAIAGTSGKTTTTSMATWALLQIGEPISYLNGSTVPYGPAGKYQQGSQYITYECDEFDRNFLHYHPYLSLITSLAYDHVEIYPTTESYYEAFAQFADQSQYILGWSGDDRDYFVDKANYSPLTTIDPRFTLPGEVNRKDATLVLEGLKQIGFTDEDAIIDALNRYPGTYRRFERLAPDLYTDYAHLPAELRAMLQKAREIADDQHKKVALIYAPLQNERQYHVRDEYASTFGEADRVIWLPTYFIPGREFERPVLSPAELIEYMGPDKPKATPSDYGDALVSEVRQLLADNYLVVVASGGSDADKFFRDHLADFAR